MTGGAGPKIVGSEWERRVVAYLRERGFDAERLYGAGRPDDVGDLYVGAWVPLLVECKAAVRSERAVWIDALRRKVARSRDRAIPIIVERRRGKRNAGEGFVTLDLAGFCDLIEQIAKRVGDLDERDERSLG